MGKDKEKDEKVVNAALAGAADEVVKRYGSAAKEHLVAYSGHDYENNIDLKRSLKSIAKSKVNPDYKDTNIKQQAGFSAETKQVARSNAESIINRGKKRVIRADDNGSVNDEIYDLLTLDSNGNAIKGSGVQMKFVGVSPDELLKKLNSSKFEKYFNSDAKICLASDDYDALMGTNGQPGLIDKKIEELNKQIKKLKQKGDIAAYNKKLEQLNKYKTIKKKLTRASLTRKEAIEARKHPVLSTTKDIVKTAHRAGVEQAKIGAAVSGTVSFIRNIVSIFKGEKEFDEAAKDIVVDTGKGAAVSYTTGFSGTIVKSAMQNSKNELVRSASKTNLPARLVSTTLNIGKTMSCYMKGEIDGAECIEMLGQDGFSEMVSAMFATAGTSIGSSITSITIAGTTITETSVVMGIIGGIAASTLGYTLAIVAYQKLAESLKDAKIARERRIQIEKECEETIKLIQEYRKEMNEKVEKYIHESITEFNNSFAEMDKAIIANDIDGFIAGNNRIKEVMGYQIQFNNQDEFNALMESNEAFIL